MREIIELVNQMSPYLLLGFLLAGVMHSFVPATLYRRYLGENRFRSVLNAALLGVPLPLCSCGVIPTAMSLRREGASRGATVSFLIATPQTGVDSIFATYSLMGLPFALLRPIAALVTALVGGTVVNMFDGGDAENSKEQSAVAVKLKQSFGQKVVAALRYGFVEMMQDIGRWLIVGLVVAGLITVFVPDSFFALFADNSLLSMLLVLVFAVPMYLCATGSIPIAVALMLKGLSPGTALVLLMAGPAVNVASMLVVGKVMGRKTVLLYLGSIIAGAILFGLGIDYLLPRWWFVMPIAQMAECCSEPISYFNIGCTILLALLLVNALMRRFSKGDQLECEGSTQCECDTPGECSAKGCLADSSEPCEQIYYIDGLRCNHCRANAEKAIASLDGVESCEVDLASGRAVVKGPIGRSEVSKAVETLGFKLKE